MSTLITKFFLLFILAQLSRLARFLRFCLATTLFVNVLMQSHEKANKPDWSHPVTMILVTMQKIFLLSILKPCCQDQNISFLRHQALGSPWGIVLSAFLGVNEVILCSHFVVFWVEQVKLFYPYEERHICPTS